MSNILEVRNLSKQYLSVIKNFKVHKVEALKDISFSIQENKVIAIAGESASGKTTLGKILIGAETYDSGEIFLEQRNIKEISTRERAKIIRMVAENPKLNLNPSLKINQILSQTLRFSQYKSEKNYKEIIIENLLQVGLLPEQAEFYPSMLSNEEKQKINVIKAIILKPKIIILDLELIYLDTIFKMQIIKLLIGLKKSLNISLIFLVDDLDIIDNLCDEIIVILDGSVIQKGAAKDVVQNPINSYAEGLIRKYNLNIKK